jgi:hypothetical protein
MVWKEESQNVVDIELVNPEIVRQKIRGCI